MHGGWPSGHTARRVRRRDGDRLRDAEAQARSCWRCFIAVLVAQSRVEGEITRSRRSSLGALLGFLHRHRWSFRYSSGERRRALSPTSTGGRIVLLVAHRASSLAVGVLGALLVCRRDGRACCCPRPRAPARRGASARARDALDDARRAPAPACARRPRSSAALAFARCGALGVVGSARRRRSAVSLGRRCVSGVRRWRAGAASRSRSAQALPRTLAVANPERVGLESAPRRACRHALALPARARARRAVAVGDAARRGRRAQLDARGLTDAGVPRPDGDDEEPSARRPRRRCSRPSPTSPRRSCAR